MFGVLILLACVVGGESPSRSSILNRTNHSLLRIDTPTQPTKIDTAALEAQRVDYSVAYQAANEKKTDILLLVNGTPEQRQQWQKIAIQYNMIFCEQVPLKRQQICNGQTCRIVDVPIFTSPGPHQLKIGVKKVDLPALLKTLLVDEKYTGEENSSVTPPTAFFQGQVPMWPQGSGRTACVSS